MDKEKHLKKLKAQSESTDSLQDIWGSESKNAFHDILNNSIGTHIYFSSKYSGRYLAYLFNFDLRM